MSRKAGVRIRWKTSFYTLNSICNQEIYKKMISVLKELNVSSRADEEQSNHLCKGARFRCSIDHIVREVLVTALLLGLVILES